MVALKKANCSNRLVTSPHYGRILREYREWLLRDGAVETKKFFEQVVFGLVPNYGLNAFYAFVKKFKTFDGLSQANTLAMDKPPAETPSVEIDKTRLAIASNQKATANLIQIALNISADRAKHILEHPELLSNKDALDLGIKAMKAQDSRIHAIGKIREDNREQEKFERAFEGSTL
jgi:hypothetical protein